MTSPNLCDFYSFLTLVSRRDTICQIKQFAGYASEVVTVARQKADQLFDSLDAFSVGISTQVIASGQQWPFVSMKAWTSSAQRLKVLTGIEDPAIVFCPIVEDYQRHQWIQHVILNAPEWYGDSIADEDFLPPDATVSKLMNKTLPFIHFYDANKAWRPAPVETPGQSLPAWQTYPLRQDQINPLLGTNYDILKGQRIADLYSFTNITHDPSIGFTQVITDTTSEEVHARSQIMQPIFDQVVGDGPKKLVGVVWMRVEFIDYFQNLLVEGVNGMIVVLKSTCPRVDVFDRNEDGTPKSSNGDLGVISYQIDGPNAIYLGEHDAHDSKYDHLEVTEKFVALDIDQSNIPEDKCIPELSLHVYPSQTFENDSVDKNKAVIYTVIVICIFIFPALVFFVYDRAVRRRQRKVMERIIKQDRIVSNIFPTAIRERLYGASNKNKKKKKSRKTSMNLLGGGAVNHPTNSEGDGTTSSFSGGGDEPAGDDSLFDPLDYEDDEGMMKASAPLADLFPNTTIVFADIAGFTAWSSAREPPQVFMLLESIYGAFDKIAYRHGVFKVETVGDCYVAGKIVPRD